MSIIKTGVVAHDNAIALAEATRQVAVAAAASQAAVRTAEIVFYRAALASAKTNNNSSGVEQFSTALRELGTGGA
jgi:hypothetical protein